MGMVRATEGEGKHRLTAVVLLFVEPIPILLSMCGLKCGSCDKQINLFNYLIWKGRSKCKAFEVINKSLRL